MKDAMKNREVFDHEERELEETSLDDEHAEGQEYGADGRGKENECREEEMEIIREWPQEEKKMTIL